jgi:hypothetical protein
MKLKVGRNIGTDNPHPRAAILAESGRSAIITAQVDFVNLMPGKSKRYTRALTLLVNSEGEGKDSG